MEYFSIFAYIAFVLLVALLSTRLMKVLKLPNVTGYIITGILVGPFAFGLFFNNFSFNDIDTSPIFTYVDRIKWLSNVALGFIAFSIGTSFKKSILKSVGKKVVIITIMEALGGSLVVILSLFALYFIFPNQMSIEVVLTLSAIASATAPAATLMVIKQYKAKGEFVNTLLAVVALDDAVALILFAVLFQIATTISSGGSSFDLYKMIFKPLIEIGISILSGVLIGFFITLLNKLFKSRNNKIVLCIFTVFLSLGLYFLFKAPFMGGFELSSLLMCMMSGAIFTNFAKDSDRTLDVLDRLTSPIYMMFFVLSGASLDLRVFFDKNGLSVLLIALVYIIFRVVGKWLGSYTGASITKSSKEIKNYLGFALVPQAGVAIGLATTANAVFSEHEETKAIGTLIMSIILTSTLVYELIGPLCSKFALTKAGAIEKEK